MARRAYPPSQFCSGEQSMQLEFTEDQRLFREEVRTFLQHKLPERLRIGARLSPGVFVEPDIGAEWQAILEEKGWLVYHWPASAGGPGWTPIQKWIFEKECAEAGAPALPGMGLKLVGPVIYTFGSEAQKAHYLPRLRSGEDFWAQGFSEPGSGSDLASLKTKAVLDGDRYLVSGSKIWTTQAQYANRLFCLARTDPSVKPQRGITFLLIDMKQESVTVRPILSMSGDHEINEVFLDNVEVPAADRVGDEGQGWAIAKFLLENERGGASFAPALVADIARLRQFARSEIVEDGRMMLDDPDFSTRLMRLSIEAEALEMTELRSICERENGHPPDHRTLTTKLIASEVRQGINELAAGLFGYAGLQWPQERPFYGAGMPPPIESREAQIAAARYLNARAWSIFGGTSEIQLNIIAKAALGL
jgi:alkylation response protein AidB-like acyl-CoA dehydrogenase